MKLSDSQKWLVLVSVVILGWLVYLLAPVLTPFMIAALLAYLGDPLTDALEDRGMSRTLAVVVVFTVMTLLFVAVFLLLLPTLQNQLAQLIRALPGYGRLLQEQFIPWLQNSWGVDLSQLELSSLTSWLGGNWGEASDIAAQVVKYVTASGTAFLGWVANLVLIPVVGFYLLRDWDRLVAGIDHLLPRAWHPTLAHLAKESDEMLSAFLRGQLTVMVSLGVIYAVGLWLADVRFALLIGMLSGLVSFVPYLGFIIGIVVASVATLFQTPDVMALLPVFAVFAVGQAVEGMVLTPLLVGDRIGLHPVAVIFAILAGGQLFGFMGVLLALPVAAVIAVIVRDLHRRYLDSEVYQVREGTDVGDSS